jgi:hypothetical protein
MGEISDSIIGTAIFIGVLTAISAISTVIYIVVYVGVDRCCDKCLGQDKQVIYVANPTYV